MATAACPTPPVAEWMSTLSPAEMRARSCRLYQAVACALGTAAARLVGSPGGSVTARLASQVTNVAQAPSAEIPPTRSPTLWLVTPGPTAVTTPAKSAPSLGSRPSKLGYRPNATSTSAKFRLDAVTETSI